MMRCNYCKTMLVYLGAMLGGVKMWGCPKCKLVFYSIPGEK